MRIIQTVNDTIRLLFNPKTETFRLSDFLLVRDVGENFLAQVVEIYDDKFDQEANVAKIKLIYRIVNGNEIAPFDNYTPSRECEVAKIKQSEIEKCTNLNKKTIELGTSYFSKEKMEINTDFFENNCVIFADKFEQTNQIFANLAPRLSSIKPVLILDFSGSCNLNGIHPYVAGENFKLPLSSETIDYIQQKTLTRAKLETQVVLGDVFEEVKKFLIASEDNYIPIQRFIKVVQNQCKQTPSVELLVLISWLKKYAREAIFAKNKREFESFFKSLAKNKITTLDLSNIKTEWQKEFLEYIISNIKNDIFLLIRLNDNNINNDIINSIYLKKHNITLIPSFAYGYKKAPYIMDFAQNYLLMPTLNPKRDFAHANFQIQSLNKEAYLIFGEDTKDFIFVLENEVPAKKINNDEEKDKVFISLNLQLEDMTPLELRPNNFEIKTAEPRKKRLQEEIKLSDILSVEKSDNEIEPSKEETPTEPKTEVQDNTEDTTLTKEEPETTETTETITETEENETVIEENVEENVENQNDEELPQEDTDELQPNESEAAFLMEDELDYFEQPTPQEDILDVEIEDNQFTPADEIEETSENEPDENKIDKKPEVKTTKENSKKQVDSKPEIKAQPAIKIKEEESELEEDEASESEIINFAKIQEADVDEPEEIDTQEDEESENADSPSEETNEETEKEADPEEDKSEKIEEAGNTVSSIIDEVVQENIENKIKSEETAQKLNNIKELSEEEELNKQFNDIMNELEENEDKNDTIQVAQGVSIDLEKIKKQTPKTKLPVFDEDVNPNYSKDYKEGDKVSHEKYGVGEILKVIQYGERRLLQIEFPEIGKRLLDPKIAKLDSNIEV